MKRILCFATLLATMLCLHSCGDGEDISNNENGDGIVNGHEYVDLGLSVKWAACNVGAAKPEDAGDYFAWGEVSPKENYTMENSITYGDATITDVAGNPQYDAACARWGAGWRLPTKEEMQELMDHCTYEWTVRNGVSGALFTSGKNGKSIFLPAAGYGEGAAWNSTGTEGIYWTATPYEYNSCYAYCANFSMLGGVLLDAFFRDLGRTIRPVTE